MWREGKLSMKEQIGRSGRRAAQASEHAGRQPALREGDLLS